MTLKAGKLRHKVSIQEPAYVQDSDGEMVPTWNTVARVWAEIAPLSAREFIAAQANQSEVRGRITLRYKPWLVPTMRILHGNTVYQIQGVLPDNVSGLEYMTLPVDAGVNLGE